MLLILWIGGVVTVGRQGAGLGRLAVRIAVLNTAPISC